MAVSKHQFSKVRRCELRLTPREVAARCAAFRGSVFFDTANYGGHQGRWSIVAFEPEFVLEGNLLEDSRELSNAVKDESVPFMDCGFPVGLAAGSVDYDGSYEFGFYDTCAIFDHRTATWQMCADMEARIRETPHPAELRRGSLKFRSHVGEEEYCETVRRAQAYIAAGDIYQVNLAHRFSAPFHSDPWSCYESLRHYSPAPYGVWMRQRFRTILSASPECFLRMSGDMVRTRPIKGTRPRRSDPLADERSAYDLISSQKELAELIMITDLERNDLGRICKYGSVVVRDLLRLERFEQVFHLVSTIDGQLLSHVDHVEALRACFPGGSITGAPKRRAREIIAELEPEARGLYTGALGFLGYNGESHFSIAIRTMILESRLAHFNVGAGIVADSIPESEYQETLDKASGILLATA
jgi:para-aminobenzoate synthetase component 1